MASYCRSNCLNCLVRTAHGKASPKQLGQSLNAEINTLAYPGAAGLCFCLALTLFNMMSTIKSQLRANVHDTKSKQPIEISYYYMALEIAASQAGLEIAIDECYWDRFSAMSTSEFVRFFQATAGNAIPKRYRKHTRAQRNHRRADDSLVPGMWPRKNSSTNDNDSLKGMIGTIVLQKMLHSVARRGVCCQNTLFAEQNVCKVKPLNRTISLGDLQG